MDCRLPRRPLGLACAAAVPSCRATCKSAPCSQLGQAAPVLSPLPPADNWGFSQLGNNPMGPSPNALKYQVIGTLHAAAYMRGASRLLPLLLLPWVVLLLLF